MEKYVRFFTLSFLHTLKNGKLLVGLAIFLLACLVIFSNLWQTIASKIGAIDLNTNQLLWYIAMNQWILISIPAAEREIEIDLRTGRLATLLPRPVSYLSTVFFESMGLLFANLIFLGLISFGFTWLLVGAPPASPLNFTLQIAAGLLAGVVGTLFQMILGLFAFWLHEVDPLRRIWEKLLFALGGLILPLSLFPSWWQNIARFTPFPYLLGYRSALVLDSNWTDLFVVTTGLTISGLFGFTILALLYQKGLKIINAEGG